MVIFGGSSEKMVDILQMGLNASSKRNMVINNNIANSSTPNYKRQDITFQKELQRALDSEKYYEQNGDMLKLTHEKHIPITRPKDYRAVQAKKTTNFNSYQNNNGNSVDIDVEMLESAKNSMYYNSLAQRTAKEFNKINFLLRQ
jgi:flagellar basal-body rod protein FlgB